MFENCPILIFQSTLILDIIILNSEAVLKGKEKEVLMPSVTTITSYKPVTGFVNRTAQKATQKVAIRNLHMTEAGFKKMVKMQNLKTIGDMNVGYSMVGLSGEDGICTDYDEETGRCDCSGLT